MKEVKRRLNNWKFNCRWWLQRNSPVYINSMSFKKLYKDWKPVKEYFKKPVFGKCTHWYAGRWWKQWLILEVHSLGWKTKYDEYRHEYDPYIKLSVFGHMFKWEVTAPEKYDDMIYYETILEFDNMVNYMHKDPALSIYKSIRSNTWTRHFGHEDESETNAYDCLTEYGKRMYKAGKDMHKKLNDRKLKARSVSSDSDEAS